MSNNKDVEKKIKKEYGGLLGIIMNIALIIAALIFVISLFATISEVRRVYENASGSISSMTQWARLTKIQNITVTSQSTHICRSWKKYMTERAMIKTASGVRQEDRN